MADNLATLVKGEEKIVVGVDTPEAQAAFAQGFTLPEAVGAQETTVAEAPTGEIQAQQTTEVTTPQVFDEKALLGNIQSTFDKFGGQAGANEAFIQGVAKFGTGREATPEQLASLTGKPLSHVISDFNIGGALQGFGVTAPEVTESPTVEEPTAPTAQVVKEPTQLSAAEQIQQLLAGAPEALAEARATAIDEAQLTAKSEALAAAQSKAQQIASDLQAQFITDIKEQDIIAGKPISNAAIAIQQSDLSREQKLDAMLAQNEYNNALVEVQIAQGNFDRAQEIVQETADEFFQNMQFQLQALEQQGVIEAEQATRLEEQASFERDLALNGFVQIKDPANLEGLTEDQIFRDPVSGKIFKKPVEDVAGDFDFIKGTENQIGGVFDPSTGTFTPYLSGGDTGNIVSTSTGDTYDIGSYATDPTHEASVQKILNSIGQFTSTSQIDEYIQRVAPESPVTGQMIANASEKYGVSWEMIAAIMQQDSSFGTRGLGARTFNPGNVGNTDDGSIVNYGDWQSGVDAVASNLSWRKTQPQAVDSVVAGYVERVNSGNLTDK